MEWKLVERELGGGAKRGAKQAPQQPEGEGTSSASYLEVLPVITPGSGKTHFSPHTLQKALVHRERRAAARRSWDPEAKCTGERAGGFAAWKFPADQDFFSFPPFQGSMQEARLAQASSPANKGTNVQGCSSLLLL